MLNTLKSIGSLSKRKKAEKPVVVESSEDQELVIQTKEQSLSGKTSDLGYGGTALGGCGAAWTRSFKMENVSAKHVCNLCMEERARGGVRGHERGWAVGGQE
jgi:hypothetical protein